MSRFLFSSESVCEGHPDKLCDQVSDAILDACLTVDPNAKVACETIAKKNLIMVFGEITVNGTINYEKIVEETVKKIGYDSEEKGLDYKTMKVMVEINSQSREIAAGVHLNKSIDDIGAGDQGHVFGYACNETSVYMPLSHYLASELAKRLSDVRKDGTLKWLRPDGKTQVTVEYERSQSGRLTPRKVQAVLISAQHDPDVDYETIKKDLLTNVISPVIPKHLLDDSTIFYINPSNSFVMGGPHADSGLTGRKIIVDTYGGWGSHGGGCFSGKDSSKVDRSAAYLARQAAKSLVANGFCQRVSVQVCYAIGIAQPVSMHVYSFGTVCDNFTDNDLEAIVERNFNFKPGYIIRDLELQKPVFSNTAVYGHFGRTEFAWEKIVDLSHEKVKH